MSSPSHRVMTPPRLLVPHPFVSRPADPPPYYTIAIDGLERSTVQAKLSRHDASSSAAPPSSSIPVAGTAICATANSFNDCSTFGGAISAPTPVAQPQTPSFGLGAASGGADGFGSGGFGASFGDGFGGGGFGGGGGGDGGGGTPSGGAFDAAFGAATPQAPPPAAPPPAAPPGTGGGQGTGADSSQGMTFGGGGSCGDGATIAAASFVASAVQETGSYADVARLAAERRRSNSKSGVGEGGRAW